MKKFLWIAGIIIAVLLLPIMYIWFTIHGVSSWTPTEDEKQLLLSVSCLKDYEIEGLNPQCCESCSATRNLDGTLELEYEYESDRDPNSPQPLYFNSAAEINPTVKDARLGFFLTVQAIIAGIKLSGDCQVEEAPDALAAGDQKYSALIKADGQALGVILIVRQGKIVHTLIVSGIYMDIKDAEAFLLPILEKSKHFQVK